MDDSLYKTYQKQYQKKIESKFGNDKEYGPMIYHPYAGGVRFPYKEKIYENPGAKVWVDGG